jgi:hypothetical protein
MSEIGHNIMQYVWLALSLVGGVLQIAAVAFFIRHRGPGPWIMMVAAVLGLLVSLSHHLVTFIGNARNLWGPDSDVPLHTVMQCLGFLGNFSWILFSVGLMITGIKLAGLHSRMKQLESIIEGRNPQ